MTNEHNNGFSSREWPAALAGDLAVPRRAQMHRAVCAWFFHKHEVKHHPSVVVGQQDKRSFRNTRSLQYLFVCGPLTLCEPFELELHRRETLCLDIIFGTGTPADRPSITDK